jgi:hypothetical protein
VSEICCDVELKVMLIYIYINLRYFELLLAGIFELKIGRK